MLPYHHHPQLPWRIPVRFVLSLCVLAPSPPLSRKGNLNHVVSLVLTLPSVPLGVQTRGLRWNTKIFNQTKKNDKCLGVEAGGSHRGAPDGSPRRGGPGPECLSSSSAPAQRCSILKDSRLLLPSQPGVGWPACCDPPSSARKEKCRCIWIGVRDFFSLPYSAVQCSTRVCVRCRWCNLHGDCFYPYDCR